jgi:16S rRNA (guanine527-N7)-methyltransferase
LPENSVVMAMVRGLSTISRTILMARKIFLKGGYLYHLKSEEWGLEVSEIPTQLCSVWAPALTADYRLPLSGVKFSIIRTEKIG